MITITSELLAKCRDNGGLPVQLRCLDHGDAYSTVCAGSGGDLVPGTLCTAAQLDGIRVSDIGTADDHVRVIASWHRLGQDSDAASPESRGVWRTRGYVREDDQWQERAVEVVPVRDRLFSRIDGIFETGAIADKRIFVVGQGSGGAPTTLDLVKSGVSHLILMDHDRLTVGNVARHVLGLSDVGRLKVKAMADRIRDKNPFASVETWAEKVCWETQDLVRQCARKSDLVICASDEHYSRVILNKICVEENTPLLMAGCFRRAYGGQVLRIRPRKTICYQCFLQALPEAAHDREISSQEDANPIQYSDRPVPIEPGLATDIAAISLMVSKLAIQELLQGQPTTLQSLDEDLVASWYIFLNRREKDTDYEGLDPLEFNVGSMTILRWYGIAMDRDPGCPCCGDFLTHAAAEAGIEISQAAATAFAGVEDV